MKNMNPSAVREIFKVLGDPSVISFAGGNPNEVTFPGKELADISARMYAENPAAFLQYGISEGYAPLREATMARMRAKHNVGSDNDDIMIVTGGEEAIDLALKTFTNEGDTVLCENPSFVGALNDIRSYRQKLVGIPVDDEGMDMDALENALKTEKNVKLIYTIPTFQNPTGVTMSLERRKKLYELAVKYDVLVLEDSPYFELRYGGEDVPCIKSMDTTGHVIFCGSYSKVVSPGLRVGFIILDKSLMGKLTVAKQCVDVHTPVYSQMLIHRYITEYDFDAHIADNCNLYRKQRDLMLAGLEANLPDSVSFTRPEGGLFIWCRLPEGYSGNELCALASAKKVACVPGNAFDPTEDPSNPGFRLNFSMPSPEQIEKGCKILGDCIKEYLK
jgi:2-aminoadipate transaminase